MSGRKVPSERGPAWARYLGLAFSQGLWNTEVVGAQRVPRVGPVVVAANHAHWIDGPLLMGSSPRGLHLLVKEESFHGPAKLILVMAGQIRTDRKSGRPALAAGLGVLRQSGAIGIFPEGTRGAGDMADARAGAAWLAVNGHAPVVPVAILGTRAPGGSTGGLPPPRRRFYVEFGEPIELEVGDRSRRVAIGEGTERIRLAMAALVLAASRRTGHVLPGPVDQGQ